MDEEPKVIIRNSGIQFIRKSRNNFELSYTIENNNLNLVDIINFDFIKLVYDLNKDMYEYTHLNKISETYAKFACTMKPFFEDLGILQKYSYMEIHKYVEDNKITFVSTPITTEKPDGIPKNTEQVKIKQITSICSIETPHKINVYNNIIIHENHKIPPFLEKFLGNMLCKIFSRIKLFIDKCA